MLKKYVLRSRSWRLSHPKSDRLRNPGRQIALWIPYKLSRYLNTGYKVKQILFYVKEPYQLRHGILLISFVKSSLGKSFYKSVFLIQIFCLWIRNCINFCPWIRICIHFFAWIRIRIHFGLCNRICINFCPCIRICINFSSLDPYSECGSGYPKLTHLHNKMIG